MLSISHGDSILVSKILSELLSKPKRTVTKSAMKASLNSMMPLSVGKPSNAAFSELIKPALAFRAKYIQKNTT